MRSFRALAGVLTGLLLAPVLVAAAPAARAQDGTVTAISPLRQAVTPGTATLTARVTSAGSAKAGVPVQFWVRRPNHTWSLLRTQGTDSRGYTRYAFAATGRYEVLARFPGTASLARSDSAHGSITEKAIGQRVLDEAGRHRGAPYQWGATGPSRFDCSGFTMYVFARVGRRLPHNSGQQYGSVRHIAAGSKRVGDLIFTYSGGRIGHVAIFAGYSNGAGYIWDAPHSGSYVQKRRLWTTSYSVGRAA